MQNKYLPIYVNDGMGVESQAIFLRWYLEPETRCFLLGGQQVPFEWEQITMLSAQTGSEDRLTKFLMEQYKLPLYRELGIRYVQVARAGPHEQDGIVILSDTRSPDTLYTEGAYQLADELKVSGTVPQYGGGIHKCAISNSSASLTRVSSTSISTSRRSAPFVRPHQLATS